MGRPRQNDPLGTTDNPVTVSDPAREAQLTEEFLKRLDHIARNFSMVREHFGDVLEFNRSLNRLKRGVTGKASRKAERRRLHPEIEMVISHHARKHAAARTGRDDADLVEADVEAAVSTVLSTIKPRRGRPGGEILRYHVEGLMALIQEMSGKPVMATRDKGNEYDPQFADGISSIVPAFFKGLDDL